MSDEQEQKVWDWLKDKDHDLLYKRHKNSKDTSMRQRVLVELSKVVRVTMELLQVKRQNIVGSTVSSGRSQSHIHCHTSLVCPPLLQPRFSKERIMTYPDPGQAGDTIKMYALCRDISSPTPLQAAKMFGNN